MVLLFSLLAHVTYQSWWLIYSNPIYTYIHTNIHSCVNVCMRMCAGWSTNFSLNLKSFKYFFHHRFTSSVTLFSFYYSPSKILTNVYLKVNEW